MARRRANQQSVTTIFWRDIPAQVTVTANGTSEKVLLEPRFQHAIDRAAAVAGMTETEAYISQWRRETNSLDAGVDAQQAAQTVADRLNDAYPKSSLEDLVAAGGVDAARC